MTRTCIRYKWVERWFGREVAAVAGWWIGALNCWGHFLVYIPCILLFIHQWDQMTDKATRNEMPLLMLLLIMIRSHRNDFMMVTMLTISHHKWAASISMVMIALFAIFVFMIISRLTRLNWGLRIEQKNQRLRSIFIGFFIIKFKKICENSFLVTQTTSRSCYSVYVVTAF